MKKSVYLLISICGLCLLNGCASGGGATAPPVATHFSVTPATSNPTAGAQFNFTVTALDSSNAAVNSYAGTVHFTSTDGQAVLPPDSALANGTGNYTATMKTVGAQTITASTTFAGTSRAITVSPAAASQLSLSVPGNATTRTLINFSVNVLDIYGNVATGYSGAVHFASSDPNATLPANSPLPN